MRAKPGTKSRRIVDQSRTWNVYGSGNVLLKDGDCFLGGLFTLKRVSVGEGEQLRGKQ